MAGKQFPAIISLSGENGSSNGDRISADGQFLQHEMSDKVHGCLRGR